MKIRLRGRLEKPSAAEACLDSADLTGKTNDQTHLLGTLKKALADADECLAKKILR
jgi:hypothetical protein